MNRNKFRAILSLVLTAAVALSLFCGAVPTQAATERFSGAIQLTDFVKDGLSEVTGDDYDGDGKYLKVTVDANSSGNPMSFVSVSDLDPNGVYKVTAWMKNDTAVKSAYLSATVTYYDGVAASGATVNNAQTLGEYRDSSFMQTVHTEWTQYVLTGIRPQADGVIKVGMWVNNKVYVDGTANTETDFVAYVDAVTITRVPATYTINEKALTTTRTSYGTPATDLPSTYVTGASDDQDGNGNYARLNATYHTGRKGYVIFPSNAYGIVMGDPNKTYTGKFWYRSSGTVSGYIHFNTDYKVDISTSEVSQWTEATVTGVVPRATDGAFFIGAWLTKNTSDTTLDLWVDVDHITLTEEITTPYSKTIDLADFERTNTNSTADVQGPDDADGDGKYLKITVPTDSSPTVKYNYTSKYAALDPNKTYTLAGWFKTSKAGANLGNFSVACGGEGQTYTKSGYGYTIYTGGNNWDNGLTTEWKYREIKNITPSSTGDIQLAFWARAYSSSQEYFYIDGLTLYEQVDVSSLVTEAPAEVADALPTLTMLGASVRGGDEIRFGIEVGEKGWEEDTVVDEVKYGTLFIPTDLLGDAELTLTTADVLDIPTRLWQENMPGYEDRDLYTCVLSDVPSADTAVTARGYMLYRIDDTWYVQYSGAASRTINGVYEAVTVPHYDALEGKTLVVFGDSTVYGHTLANGVTWSALLAEKYDMEYSNKGLNGSGIYMSTMEGREPMYTRYTSLPDDADILFVMGGVNDYYKKATLGNVTDTTATSFAGALNVLITGLKEKYPNTLILFSTPYYKNADLQKYSDMVMAVCAAQGVPCFDASNQVATGVYMDDAAFRATYCVSDTDTDHLNEFGMQRVLPAFEKYIGEQYTAYLTASNS